MLRPKSRGAIRLRSSDPFAAPLIQANYLTDQQDVDTMVAGLKVGLQLIETDAFKVFFFIFSAFSNFGFQRAGAQLWEPLPLCSSLTMNSDEYLECYVRHTAGTGSSLLKASSEIIESVLILTSYIFKCSLPPCWHSSPWRGP